MADSPVQMRFSELYDKVVLNLKFNLFTTVNNWIVQTRINGIFYTLNNY